MVRDLDHSEPKFRNREDVVSVKLGVSRRNLMKQLGAIGAAGAIAGCSSVTQSDGGGDGDGSGTTAGQGDMSNTNASAQAKDNEIPTIPWVDYSAPPTDDSVNFSEPEDPTRRMDLVTHDASIEFFLVTVVGMNDALNQLGWTGEFIGPTSNDETTQIEFLQNKISELEGGRDALGTSVLSKGSYKKPIKKAIDAGLAVVNFNTRVEWSRRDMFDMFGTHIPYVGQPDWEAGNAVGQAAFETAQQKLDSTNNLVFQPCIEVPGHPALQTRIDAAINYLEAQGEVKVLDALDVTTQVGEAKSRIGNALDANPEIDILIGTFSPAMAASGRIAAERGMTDEIVVGGFDVTPITWEQVKKGNADFTTTQDPYAQGYMPPHLAFKYLDRGAAMKNYETDVAIIRQDTIDYAARHIKELRGLLKWQLNNYENAENY